MISLIKRLFFSSQRYVVGPLGCSGRNPIPGHKCDRCQEQYAWHAGFSDGFKAADGLPSPIEQRRKEHKLRLMEEAEKAKELKGRPKPERYFLL